MNFKAGDWINAGGEINTSSEFSANVITGASVTLKDGEKARPYMRYTIRTRWKWLDHYDSSGWHANSARPDGKWLQGADLPLRVPADIEALWQGPIPTTTQNPSDPS